MEKQVAACLRVPLSVVEDEPAEARSPEFRRGDAEIRDAVTVRTSVREAEEVYAAYAQPGAPGCIARGIVAALRARLLKEVPGASLGAAVASSLPVAKTAVSAIGYRFVIPLHLGGPTIRLVFDAVSLRAGAASSTIAFANRTTPLDAATERRLTIVTARRLAGIG